MLGTIIELIEKEEFVTAEKDLKGYLNADDKKVQAYAEYLMGYINTCWRNKEKNEEKARRYLLYNLNSDFPHPNAYNLYARLEEDKNIVEKYLNQGLIKFQNHPQLLKTLLIYSQDKESVIERIQESGCFDFSLLSKVVEFLIKESKWDRVGNFIFKIQSNNTLNDEETVYLDLLSGYAYAFGENKDYVKAIELFETVEKHDMNNRLGYAHYLGLIYAYIKSGSIEKAIKYFDKLPVNNSIFDLIDGPWYFITVDFSREYKEIFDILSIEFDGDISRLKKSKCLYSLYLYNPSEIYGIYRYDENNINYLKDYYIAKAKACGLEMFCKGSELNAIAEYCKKVAKEFQ